MNELKTKSKIVISYNDCNLVRDLFEGWTFQRVEWAYGMGNGKGKSPKDSNEVFILNF